MIVRLRVLLFLALASTLSTADETADRVAAAVRNLGSEHFETREKASAALWLAGNGAEPALRTATTGSDPEVRQRAEAILKRFELGLYPDPATVASSSSEDIAATILRYPIHGEDDRTGIVDDLLKLQNPPYPLLAAIARLERREEIWNRIIGNFEIKPLLVLGEWDRAELVLERNARRADRTSVGNLQIRNYAAFCLLRGIIADRIRMWEKIVAKSSDEEEARILAYLHRAAGDLKRAAEIAAASPSLRHLALSLACEFGDRSDFVHSAPWTDDSTLSPAERLAFQAVFQYRTGDLPDLESTLLDARSITPGDLEHRYLEFANPLLLVDRWEEVYDKLLADRRHAVVMNWRFAQGCVSGAFDVIDRAETGQATTKERSPLLLLKSQFLHALGETEKAKSLLAELAEGALAAEDVDLFQSALGTAARLGYLEETRRHGLSALTTLKDDERAGFLLHLMIPETDPRYQGWLKRSQETRTWWAYLRRKKPEVPAETAFKRLLRLLDRQMEVPDVQAMADDAWTMIASNLPLDDQRYWLETIAQTLESYGAADAAAGYYRRLADIATWSDWPLVRMADIEASRNEWDRAADLYAQAENRMKHSPFHLYRRGWCLERAGRTSEGRRLQESALLLPLADGSERRRLITLLAECGNNDEVERQKVILRRTGEYNPMNAAELALYMKPSPPRADGKPPDLQVWKRNPDEVRILEDRLSDCEGAALPHYIHQVHARWRLEEGDVAAAIREAEAGMEAFPGNVDIPVEVIPELDRRDFRREADRLFSRSFARMERLSREYPRCARFHHDLARLSAACNRNVREGLLHAQKSVELDPRNEAFRNVLNWLANPR